MHPFSIWSSYDIELSPEDMVLAMERRGLTVCEFSDEHAAALLEREGTPTEIGRAFRSFAWQHGLSFPQGHLWLHVRLCNTEQDVVGILCDWIDLFAALGIRNAVLHCDSASFPKGTSRGAILAANVAVLKKLAPHAEEMHVRLCLENLGEPFCDAETLVSMIKEVGSPALGICLDTGHLNLYRPGTQSHFIRTAGDLLHALHIADNQGKTDQHMMPFGRGNVDFADVMAGLKEIGYTGLFNYEIPGEREIPMALKDAKADYLKVVTEYLFSL